MVRTQIQLTEEQFRAIKAKAHGRRISLSEAVREAVEIWLRESHRTAAVERSLRSLGRFRSGLEDVSERHDHHLAAALENEAQGK